MSDASYDCTLLGRGSRMGWLHTIHKCLSMRGGWSLWIHKKSGASNEGYSSSCALLLNNCS